MKNKENGNDAGTTKIDYTPKKLLARRQSKNRTDNFNINFNTNQKKY